MDEIKWMVIPTDQFLILLMEVWMSVQMALFFRSQVKRILRERRRG